MQTFRVTKKKQVAAVNSERAQHINLKQTKKKQACATFKTKVNYIHLCLN